MKKWMAWMLAMMLMVTCGAAMGDKFVQGIDPEYPPFSYLGDDGEYTGFDVEIAKAACEIAGLEYDVFAVNWDNKLIQLKRIKGLRKMFRSKKTNMPANTADWFKTGRQS